MTHFAENQSAKRVPLPIWLLVAIHLVGAGLAYYLGSLHKPVLFLTVVLPITFAQIGLVAIAAGFSTRFTHVMGAGLGFFLCLVALAYLLTGETETLLGILFIFTLILLAALSFRFRGWGIHRFGTDDLPPQTVSLRFSIRQLLVITAAIGLLFAPAEWMRDNFDRHEVIWITIATTLLLCTPLLTLWAALGRGRAAQRSCLVVVAIATLSFVAQSYTPGQQMFWLWPSLILLQSAIMLGSLLVVRSCGYRLIKRPKRPTQVWVQLLTNSHDAFR